MATKTSHKTKKEVIDMIAEFLACADQDTIAYIASQFTCNTVVIHDGGDLFEVTEED